MKHIRTLSDYSPRKDGGSTKSLCKAALALAMSALVGGSYAAPMISTGFGVTTNISADAYPTYGYSSCDIFGCWTRYSGSATNTQTTAVSFQKFDPSLGVLMGATSTVTGPLTATSSMRMTNGQNYGVLISQYASATLNLGPLGTWNANTGPVNGTTAAARTININQTTVLNASDYVGSGTSTVNGNLNIYEYVMDVPPWYAHGTASVSITGKVDYSYLLHSNMSFNNGADQNDLILDLTNGESNFDIFAIGNQDDHAIADLLLMTCSGDCDAFDLGLGSLQNLYGGSNQSGSIALKSGMTNGQYSATYSMQFSDDTDSGVASTRQQNAIALTVNGTVAAPAALNNVPENVPEPTSIALMGLGLAGLGFARRRKA